jgi:hypothetical protein
VPGGMQVPLERAEGLGGKMREAERGAMGINDDSETSAGLQIGPTTLGMVRLYIETETLELPLDFDPDEAEEIAEELRAAAARAREARAARAGVAARRRGHATRARGEGARRVRQARRRPPASGRAEAAQGIGVVELSQPLGGGPGEAGDEGAPPRGRERGLRGHPQHRRVVGIGADHTGGLGQDAEGEIRIDRPEESVAPREIARPLAIGREIGATGLHLDDPDLRPGAERDHVDAQPAGRNELGQGREAEAAQVPADPAGEGEAVADARAGRRLRVGSGEDRHASAKRGAPCRVKPPQCGGPGRGIGSRGAGHGSGSRAAGRDERIAIPRACRG